MCVGVGVCVAIGVGVAVGRGVGVAVGNGVGVGVLVGTGVGVSVGDGKGVGVSVGVGVGVSVGGGVDVTVGIGVVVPSVLVGDGGVTVILNPNLLPGIGAVASADRVSSSANRLLTAISKRAKIKTVRRTIRDAFLGPSYFNVLPAPFLPF